MVKFVPPPDVAADTTDRDVGKICHSLLEYTSKGIDLDEAVGLLKDKSIISEKLWEERVDSTLPNIISFNDRIKAFAKTNPIQTIHTELKLGVSKDWKPCGFFDNNVHYRGVIDYVLKLQNGDIIVIDHKTGGSSEYVIRNSQFQLNSYEALFHSRYPVKGAVSGIHYIREGTVPLGERHEASYIETHIRSSIDFAIEAAIDRVKTDGYFKHVRGSLCKYCDYDNMCKSKEYTPLEEQSKLWVKENL